MRIRTLFPFSPHRITRTNLYTTTLSTLIIGNHLLFEIEDFVPRTGVEPVRPLRDTRF